jgi:protein KRI1
VVDAVVADAEADIGFEDVIAGGTIKTKFRYRGVPAADFGLDTDTILRAPDKMLNQFVGLKKLAPYRDSEFTLTARRAKTARDILQSSIAESEAAAEAAAKARSRARKDARRSAAEYAAGGGSSSKKGGKKKESRKARAKRAEVGRGEKRARDEAGEEGGSDGDGAASDSASAPSHSHGDGSAPSASVMAESTAKGISKARLASYGAAVADASGKKNRRRSKKSRQD